jgi:hypothetical protein
MQTTVPSLYDTNAAKEMGEFARIVEAKYEDRIEVDLDCVVEEIDVVILPNDEGAMSAMAEKALTDLFVRNREQNKRHSRRNKVPGMGDPPQKYGLDSATTLLGMLRAMDEQDVEDTRKKVKKREGEIETLKSWIRDADNIKERRPKKYWDISDDPTDDLCKTVLRLWELPTSGSKSEKIARLQSESVESSKVEWDRRYLQWKEKLSSLETDTKQDADSVREETDAEEEMSD